LIEIYQRYIFTKQKTQDIIDMFPHPTFKVVTHEGDWIVSAKKQCAVTDMFRAFNGRGVLNNKPHPKFAEGGFYHVQKNKRPIAHADTPAWFVGNVPGVGYCCRQ